MPGLSEPVKGRWHFTYERAPVMSLSILFERTKERDATRLLVEIPSGRAELFSEQNENGRLTYESIRFVETGEALERTLSLPGAKGLPGCAKKSEMDACIRFKGKQGEASFLLSALAGENVERTRATVHGLVTPGFSERLLELVKEFPRSAEFDRYGDDFLALAWPALVPKRRAGFEMGVRRPGCDFDARFGFPCSREEKEKENARFSVR